MVFPVDEYIAPALLIACGTLAAVADAVIFAGLLGGEKTILFFTGLFFAFGGIAWALDV